MVKIVKQIVSDEVIKERSYGFGNPCNFIVIHQTGNTDEGADAQAHADIQTNYNPRQASWHYSVDDVEAIQSFPDEVRCWAATDGRGPGNMESIHIEICINSDGDYKKAVKNGAELAKMLADKHNAEIKQHHDFYPKNCPQQLREGYKGITWGDFLNMVEGKKVVDRDEQVKSEQITKDEEELTVDGKLGPATTRKAQKYFGTTVDGVISGQPVNFSTKNIPSAEFGEGGSDLIEAMQKWARTSVDRIITDPSQLIEYMQIKWNMTIVDSQISFPSNVVKEFQRRLNKGKL